MSNLSMALKYAELGWYILPVHTIKEGKCSCGYDNCTAKGKHPRIKEWEKNSSSDPSQIAEWWKKWPDANIGVQTGEKSGIICIDIDPRHGGDDSFSEMESELGKLPDNVIQLTGGGGRHYILKCPSEKISNAADIEPGVDARGENGYFIVDPSNHVSGGRYQWEISSTPFDNKPGEVPREWIDRIRARTRKQDGPAFEVAKTISEGGRNHYLFKQACSLRARGYTEPEILALIQVSNQQRCSPPISDDEVQKVVESAGKYEIGPSPVLIDDIPLEDCGRQSKAKFNYINPLESPETRKRYSYNDLGNGFLFADTFQGICRYSPEAKEWYQYNGKFWERDAGSLKARLLAKNLSKYLVSLIWEIQDQEMQGPFKTHVTKLYRSGERDIMLREAQPEYPIYRSELDNDVRLLNLKNGTLNLDTMEFKDHDPEDMLSKIAGAEYDPDAKCPRWEEFILEIMSGDSDKARFLQKVLGYTLLGTGHEECLFILYGQTTRNGKGTLLSTIMRVFGDYARNIQPETLAQKFNNNSRAPSEDLARLQGARFVNASEPKKGMKLDEALVKQLTGGDVLTARFLHENSFEFTPQFTIFINTNHLPSVTDDTLFGSGRIHLINFDRHFAIEERDTALKRKLSEKKNLSAILNWTLEGLKMYRDEGLNPPESVVKATAIYRDESDRIKMFLDEKMRHKEGAKEKTSYAYSYYQDWCKENGYMPEGIKSFSQSLKTKGIEVKKLNTGSHIMDYEVNFDDYLQENAMSRFAQKR